MESLDKWRQIGVRVMTSNGLVVTKCDTIFVCVQPQVLYKCAQEIEASIEAAVCKKDKIFISVLTGVTLDLLSLVRDFIEIEQFTIRVFYDFYF